MNLTVRRSAGLLTDRQGLLVTPICAPLGHVWSRRLVLATRSPLRGQEPNKPARHRMAGSLGWLADKHAPVERVHSPSDWPPGRRTSGALALGSLTMTSGDVRDEAPSARSDRERHVGAVTRLDREDPVPAPAPPFQSPRERSEERSRRSSAGRSDVPRMFHRPAWLRGTLLG